MASQWITIWKENLTVMSLHHMHFFLHYYQLAQNFWETGSCAYDSKNEYLVSFLKGIALMSQKWIWHLQ